jgi:hypothetical protein
LAMVMAPNVLRCEADDPRRVVYCLLPSLFRGLALSPWNQSDGKLLFSLLELVKSIPITVSRPSHTQHLVSRHPLSGLLAGLFGWPFWLAFLAGFFGWPFWVAFLAGLFGWPFWLAFFAGLFC